MSILLDFKSRINFKSFRFAWLYRGALSRRRLREEITLIDANYNSDSIKVPREDREVVVIFSSVALFTDHVITEYALASELEKAGASVIIVLCDRLMPICHAHDRYSCGVPKDNTSNLRTKNVCDSCQASRKEILKRSRFKVKSYSDYYQEDKRRPSKINIEEDSRAGVIRYLATSQLSEIDVSGLTMQYENSASRVASVVQNLIDSEKPSLIIGHHGIYVPQGVINKVCEVNQVPFYSWHFGYRKSTLIFSRGNTYHKELGAHFDLPTLLPAQRKKISDYLESRWKGSNDWIHFNRNPKALDKKDFNQKRIVFYSSVDWDAALHFDKNVYDNQFHFVDCLLRVASQFPLMKFIIRVHPAESTGNHPSHTRLDEYVKNNIVKNVEIIPADDTTSSYELAESCDIAIVYNTKLGVELTSMGIPTIVAGESWVKGRGFTWDINKPSDLEHYLSNAETLKMTDEMKKDALSFAYYFFFKRCINVPELRSISDKFHIKFEASSSIHGSGLSHIAHSLIAQSSVIVNLD